MQKAKPGDKVMVGVGGVKYETIIDEKGVQRFHENKIISSLCLSGKIDLNALEVDYRMGKFDQRSYAEFKMMLGYSVDGFSALSAFQDMEIENPLWM